MKPTVEQLLLKSIEATRLIAAGDRVGVAVSGGADSVALLRLLEAARAATGFTLKVLHFDHQLRRESADDARFVEELAGSLGLAFVSGRGDVAGIAARERRNLEDAARRLRYEFFADVVAKGQVTRVAVAHTLDDQAETVLARLLRGTGPAGLAGIHSTAGGGTIMRPLLQVRRARLREYLNGLGQTWREDATNSDTSRQRARIRRVLLPLLEKDFSSDVAEHLATLAGLSEEEGKFWTALVEDRFEVLVSRRADAVSISLVNLLSPLDLTRAGIITPGEEQSSLRSLTERLIRRLYKSVCGEDGELTSLHVEEVIRLASASATGKRIELPGGVLAMRNFCEITFSRRGAIQTGKIRGETKNGAPAYHYPVRLNGAETTDVSVPELDICFRLKVIDCPSPERETRKWRIILDLDRLRQPLVLRNWQPGDGYRPRGRSKARKLKDMFIAARVAAGERRSWPVLESDGQVVWAKGMDPADDFCAREGTRAGVLIEERKL
jgi:tRNA(Ile)-lysidine synthase